MKISHVLADTIGILAIVAIVAMLYIIVAYGLTAPYLV